MSSVRMSQRVELVVSLERWEAGQEYDRLGLRDETLHHPRRRAAAGAHAGGPRPQHRDPGRGGRAQPAAQGPRATTRRRRFAERVDEMIEADAPPAEAPAAGRARRAAGARSRGAMTEAPPARDRRGRGAAWRRTAGRSRGSSSSPASPARGRRTSRGPSRTSAGSASTTCPPRSSRASPTSSTAPRSCGGRRWSSTCASTTS